MRQGLKLPKICPFEIYENMRQGLKLPKICSFEIYENMRQGLKPPRGEDVPQYLNTSLNYKNSYKEIVNYKGIVGCKIVTS